MQWHKMMAAAPLPGNTNVANDAADTATAYKNAVAFPPDAVQFRKEALIVLEMAHLIVVARGVFLQCPVGR
jgi:hypothetical protein